MAENPRKPRDRYDVTGNSEAEYVDADGLVLVNKIGARTIEELHDAEEESLGLAYATLFREVRADVPLTCELLLHIHERIFGGIYDWAGRWRTVTISKPGITWPPAQFVPQSMERFETEVLNRIENQALIAESEFCAASAQIQVSFLLSIPSAKGTLARSNSSRTCLPRGQPGLSCGTTRATRDVSGT